MHTPIRVIREFAQVDHQAVEFRLNNRKRMADITPNNTRVFALEIDNGAMVRVHVSAAQSEQFEQELAAAIAANPDADVGNLLYELTRFYDIYDIQWIGEFDDTAPVKEADDVPPAPTDIPDGDLQGDMPAADSEVTDPDEFIDDNSAIDLDTIDDGDEVSDEELEPASLKDMLQTFMSQMTADAEARRAEAEAKKAEADAKKAEAVAKAMEIKVGQEREFAEMEEWEDKEKEKTKRQKELDRLAKFRLAKAQGLTDSTTPSDLEPLNEDWGSSDWSAVIYSVARDLRDYHNSSLAHEAVRSAVETAAEFYFDAMGYHSVDDAADRIEAMFYHRLAANGNSIEGIIARYEDRPVEEATPSAVAPQIGRYLRRINQAVRSQPQVNPKALDNVEDAALDMLTDIQAQRAQGAREISQERRSGASPDELKGIAQVNNIRNEFARRLATLRKQMDQAISKVRR